MADRAGAKRGRAGAGPSPVRGHGAPLPRHPRVTDFRWFGLRDNNSDGPDYQSYFGLLRSNYSKKPAFYEYFDARQ